MISFNGYNRRFQCIWLFYHFKVQVVGFINNNVVKQANPNKFYLVFYSYMTSAATTVFGVANLILSLVSVAGLAILATVRNNRIRIILIQILIYTTGY